MSIERITIVNTEISIKEFENGYYICPNISSYSFKIEPSYLAAHHNKQVKYLAQVRATGVVKLVDGEYKAEPKKYYEPDKDVIKDLLINAYKEAQRISNFDRTETTKAEGSKVFLLREVHDISADYTPGYSSFSKVIMELHSKEKITTETMVRKLRYKNLNDYTLRDIDLDLLEETKLPEHFRPISLDLLDDIVLTTDKVLFCNIAWMDKYQGEEEQKMRTGGAFVREHGYGGEMYNFYVEPDGFCRGYVRSTGTNRIDDFESTIDVKRIDSSAINFVDNVLVVWVANNDKDKLGTRIIGYYKNAKVYSKLQTRHAQSVADMPFIIETKSEYAFCIPAEFRKMQVPRGREGFLGQSNVWYADSNKEDVKDFVAKTKKYISQIDKGQGIEEVVQDTVSTWIISCDCSKYNIEDAFRKYETIEWEQKPQLNNIAVDDIVYIYTIAPYSRIQYKCIVEDINLSGSFQDEEFMKDKTFFSKNEKFFKIRLLKKVGSASLQKDTLRENGLNGNIQGPRKLSGELLEFIDNQTNNSMEQLIADKEEINIISKLSEEEIEAIFEAKDEDAGYIYKETLTKYRKINQQIVNQLKDKYSNTCQICGEQIGGEFGEGIVHAHHIEYFSQTQNNDASNIMIVCPNHHAIIHKHNPYFNRENMCYEFSNGDKLTVKNPGHLKLR